MDCSKCGFELQGGAIACPVCGYINDKPAMKTTRKKGHKNSMFKSIKKKKDYDISYRIPSSKRRVIWTPGVPNKRFLTFIACLIAVITLVIWCAKTLGDTAHDDVGVMTYLKQNELVAYYNDEIRSLSNNIINLEIEHIAVGIGADNGFGFEEDIENRGLIRLSDNKLYVYFIENYSTMKNAGDLCYSYKGKAKVKIASDVSPSFVISKDGSRVLYLQGADSEGNKGILYYTHVGKEPQKIVSDIDSGTYTLSNNGRTALFIQSYDTSVSAGDLYIRRENKDKVKVDNEVHKVFGSDAQNTTFLYAKNYDAANGTYDVYVKTEKSERVRIAETVDVSPVVVGVSNAYILGGKDGETYSFYYANLKTGEKEKIDSSVRMLALMTADKKSVIYNKPNDTDTVDYYVYTQGKGALKAASGVLNTENNGDYAEQFVTNKNFSVMAFITDYNTEKMRGTLYFSHYKGGKISDKERISDDVHSVKVSDDGKMILYAKDYSTNRNVADIFSFVNGKNNKLLDEIHKDQFSLYKNNKSVVYIADYNQREIRGDLYVAESSKKKKNIMQDCVLFRVRDNGQIIFAKDLIQSQNSFDLYITGENMNNAKKIDGNVTRILQY